MLTNHSSIFFEGACMYYPTLDFRLKDIEMNHKDIDVMVYYLNTPSAREAFDFDGVWTPRMCTRAIAESDKFVDDICWLVETKHDFDYMPVGTCTLIVDVENTIAEYAQLFIDPHVRGRGLGVKTLLAVASYAFDILKLKYIHGMYKQTNEIAIRVHEKAGFAHVLDQNRNVVNTLLTMDMWAAARLNVKAEQNFDLMMDEIV